MIYLGTNEIGNDLDVLGFPEIHSCQAIICQTKSRLYGWHDSSGNVDLLKGKADLFRQYTP
jgi:hypothetical protein